MRRIIPSLLSLAMVFVTGTGSAAPVTVTGKPEILSGDTLSVAGTVFHLQGIDAPEKGQLCQVSSGRSFDCGLVSKTALMDLTAAVSVSCRPTGALRDGLPEAQCFAAGYDLSKGMVHTGWALAWPRTGTIYGRVEITANKASRGMWRGKFIAPWDWREGRRMEGEH